MKRTIRFLVAATWFVVASANAQQDVPFNFGIPVAPEGLANQPLGDGPFRYKTGEGMDIRVVVLTKEIEFEAIR